MDKQERERILLTAQHYFREMVAKVHLKDTEKLTTEDEFNIDPFTWKYQAEFAFGNTSSESLAKALIYPRVLGTSINDKVDVMLLDFSADALKRYASAIDGIDLEFKDAMDGRHKFCQIKTGPDAVGEEEAKTIEAHFQRVETLAKENHLCAATDDCVVGVLYGEERQLSKHLRKMSKKYTVLVGQEFWEHLTGDKNFYSKLAEDFADAADELGSYDNLQKTIQSLAYDIAMRR